MSKGRFSSIHEGAQSKKPRQAFAVFVLIVLIFYGKTKTAKPLPGGIVLPHKPKAILRQSKKATFKPYLNHIYNYI